MENMFPAFFTESINRQYGMETVAQILSGMQQPRCTSLRANPLRASIDDIAAMLTEAGLAYERLPWYDAAFLLPAGSEAVLHSQPLYESGGFYMQSLSAMLPPLVLAPQSGADILDMAAAPGGKTAQMAAMTANKANITAVEVNAIRADRLRHNLQKQGVTRVNVMVRDGRKLEDFFRFDQILLDAPCSGSGTMLLSDPTGIRAFSEKLVRNSAALQVQLLRKALSLLKKGGTLVYSTCSILEVENEAVVRSALKGTSAQLEPIELPGIEDLPRLPVMLDGTLCVRPTERYEGFFIARIRKP
ncbi:MAG: RsmB/NOP family class I SAM-dependent RNA methyltransferase [Clostridia bacterium]|nr:RsmB/NOP family class I SAM-dependent RNA methyltransferase [Clostridia bacterium]